MEIGTHYAILPSSIEENIPNISNCTDWEKKKEVITLQKWKIESYNV